MLDLQVHASKDSMFNTPPVFPIYTSMLVLDWLESNGGIEAIEQVNMDKAALLYNEIDSNPLFKGTTAMEDRSKMNVTFVMTDESKAEAFKKRTTELCISGIAGHRDVGGFRASIYNAMPISSIEVLIGAMKEMNS